jgi:hypothetical protein
MFKILNKLNKFTKFSFSTKAFSTTLQLTNKPIMKVKYTIDRNIFKQIKLISESEDRDVDNIFHQRMVNENKEYFINNELMPTDTLNVKVNKDSNNIIALNNTEVDFIVSNNSEDITLDLTDSKVTLKKELKFNNLTLILTNSTIICEEPLYANSINIISKESKIDIKYLSCNDIQILANNSSIAVNELHCTKAMVIRSEGNNTFTYPSVIANGLNIQLQTTDKSNLYISDLYDNSIIYVPIYANNVITFNPFLLMGINIYLKKETKFHKLQFSDREGYSFCPTVVMDSNEELPKDYVLSKYYVLFKIKIFALMTLLFVMFKVKVADDFIYKNLSGLKIEKDIMNMTLKQKLL